MPTGSCRSPTWPRRSSMRSKPGRARPPRPGDPTVPGEVVIAAALPHSPLLLELIEGPLPERTLAAVNQVAKQVVEARPDVLVLIDPHAGSLAQAMGLFGAPVLRGDLGYLGAPQIALHLHSDLHLQNLIGGLCLEVGLPVVIPDRFHSP